MRTIRATGWLAAILMVVAEANFAQTPEQNTNTDLEGTSWKLLDFQGSDGAKLTPDDSSKYTAAFSGNGVNVRIDCNRGHATWNSTANHQLRFGPMALTRAMCPPAALNDHFANDWEFIRSYERKDDRLTLVLADGGKYEFELTGSSAGQSERGATDTSPLGRLPASFSGTLPCADCPGIHYTITLSPDHTFTSTMTYEERNAHLEQSGRWELADNNKVLVLRGDHDDVERFSIRGGNTLRKLDRNGGEINSSLNYELKRDSTSGSEAKAEAANGSLEGTHWTLTYLDGATVTGGSEKNAPYLMLDPATHRVSGSGGCNRLMGGYELTGERLTFSKLAGTMMMCPQGMETEAAFLQSLAIVSTWKLTGEGLELFGSDGKLLSRFKASGTQ